MGLVVSVSLDANASASCGAIGISAGMTVDFTADLAVTDDDPRFMTHLFAGVGISVLLPIKVKRTP